MSVFRLRIEMEGPVLTTGLGTPAYGIDTGFQRSLDGKFMLPGTLVKGVVRHMLHAMAEAAPDLLSGATLVRWFGRGSGDARDYDRPGVDKSLAPCRSIVHFGDFRLEKETAVRLTRIAVEAETGNVRRGMLQILETPVGYGETAAFVGTLAIAGADEAESAEAVRWIEKALRLVPAIGSAKSAGFGRITAVRSEMVTGPEDKRPAATAAVRDGDRVGYVLQFEEPLLVASQAISGNLFKSSEEIPGGVVKGALARVIEAAGRMPELETALDRIVIRHAKPVLVKSGDPLRSERPRTIPLSLFALVTFADGKPKLNEILDASEYGVLPDDDYYAAERATALFAPDWKPDSEAVGAVRRQLNHTADLKHEVRTRTAIDASGTGTAATSQLFSRIALDPRGHVWVGEIARGNADEAAFVAILQLMEGRLPRIGKTGATATVTFVKPATAAATQPRDAKPGRALWRIVLETDALLHGPDDVFKYRDLGAEERLAAQYLDYFRYAIGRRLGAAMAADDVQLLRFFARQRWAGGYQALRLPVTPGRYYPHLVTEAGSVFVLDASPAATLAIESFVARGLPLPQGVPTADQEYKRSPFVPQNGYGEVSIGDYFEWKKEWPGHA